MMDNIPRDYGWEKYGDSVEKICKKLDLTPTMFFYVVKDNDNNLYLSCRNLNNIRFVSAKHVSTYDIINSNMLLFDKTGVEFLNENYYIAGFSEKFDYENLKILGFNTPYVNFVINKN